jgi:hypothetical protein
MTTGRRYGKGDMSRCVVGHPREACRGYDPRWRGALTDGQVAAPRHAVDRKLDGRAVLSRQCDRR